VCNALATIKKAALLKAAKFINLSLSIYQDTESKPKETMQQLNKKCRKFQVQNHLTDYLNNQLTGHLYV